MKTRLSILLFALLLLGGNAMAAISTSPVTKDATEGATLLYKFLSDNYNISDDLIKDILLYNTYGDQKESD